MIEYKIHSKKLISISSIYNYLVINSYYVHVFVFFSNKMISPPQLRLPRGLRVVRRLVLVRGRERVRRCKRVLARVCQRQRHVLVQMSAWVSAGGEWLT